MRNIFVFLVLIMVAFQAFATDTRVYTGTVRTVPRGIRVYDLNTRNTATSNDTIAATNDNRVYGPYELCDEGEQMPTKFVIHADALTGTTPVVSFDYQIIGSKNIADTISGAWISADTLGAGLIHEETIVGGGLSIVVNLNNYDTDGAVQIPGLLRMVIPSGTSVEAKK